MDAPESQETEGGTVLERRHLQFIWWDDISKLPARVYLVKGWLDKGCFSCVYGPSNSGKTFFVADMALHVAMGRDWHGQRVNQGAVVYIAPDGGYGLRERLQALKIHYGLDGKDVPFALLPHPVDLGHEDTHAREIARLIKHAGEDPYLEISLIIVDTVSRALQGGDDNSPRDMGAFVANCDLIRQETGAHILGIHHTGKDENKGMRGSTVLLGAVDTSIEVKHDQGTDIRVALIAKQRDHAPAPPVAFTLKQVDLGPDVDGDQVTSCVVEPSDKTPRGTKSGKRLSTDQQLALDCLHEMLCEHGVAHLGNTHVPTSIRCVDSKLWRGRFYARKNPISGNEEQAKEAKKRAFIRAYKVLLAAGKIGEFEGQVWAVSTQDE